MRLKVNQTKSAVDRPWKRKFLGFSFTASSKGNSKIRVHRKSLERAKDRIRTITSRRWSISMDDRIKKLNQFLVGWRNYFALAETPTTFRRMMKWIRRRLRMIKWKEWKTPKTRKRKLRGLGYHPLKLMNGETPGKDTGE